MTVTTSTLLYQTVGSLEQERKPYIITGPVIGLVTDTTARILIETNVSTVVECELKSKNSIPVKQRIVTVRRVPSCYHIIGLIPGISFYLFPSFYLYQSQHPVSLITILLLLLLLTILVLLYSL